MTSLGADAFNVSQHHLVQVGFAHIERVILEQFIKQVERTQDPGCKAVLTKLCQLFALSQMEKNKGWYLESGYMEGAKNEGDQKNGKSTLLGHPTRSCTTGGCV